MAEQKWTMIVRGAFQEGWTLAPQEEKDEVFDYWTDLSTKWVEMGAELVATLDDELAMTGQPGLRQWNFYKIYRIPSLDMIKPMLDMYRYPPEGEIRLDKYFRFEVVVGKPIGGVERKVDAFLQACEDEGTE